MAARITEKLRIPTIGIGAGPDCDGQVLVFHDLVGLTAGPQAEICAPVCESFGGDLARGIASFATTCAADAFPSDAESFHSAAELREHLPVRERA